MRDHGNAYERRRLLRTSRGPRPLFITIRTAESSVSQLRRPVTEGAEQSEFFIQTVLAAP